MVKVSRGFFGVLALLGLLSAMLVSPGAQLAANASPVSATSAVSVASAVSSVSDVTIPVHFGAVPDQCQQIADRDVAFRNDHTGGWVSDDLQVDCGVAPDLAQLHFTITVTSATPPVSLSYLFPSIDMEKIPGTAHYFFTDCVARHSYDYRYDFARQVSVSGAYSTQGWGVSSFAPDADNTFTLFTPTGVDLTYWDQNHGKCNLTQPFTHVAADVLQVDAVSHVAILDEELEEPESLTGQCVFDLSTRTDNTANARTSTAYASSDKQAPVETVLCGDIRMSIPGAVDPATPLTPGLHSRVVYRVSNTEWVDVTGHVTNNLAGCPSRYRNLSVESKEGMSGWNVDVDASGNFQTNLPRGTWTFMHSVVGSVCDLSQTVYIGSTGPTQTIELSTVVTKVGVSLIQPAGRSDCIEGLDPWGDASGAWRVETGATSVVVPVRCGDFVRNVRAPIAASIALDGSTIVPVTVPALGMHTVSGTFAVPTGYRESDRQYVKVTIAPVTNQNDNAHGGWANVAPWSGAPIQATLDWATMTYSAEVPTGNYTLNLGNESTAPARGCYVSSYFAGSGKADVISAQFAQAIDVAESAGSIVGPAVSLKLGAMPTVLFNWAPDVPYTRVELSLFNDQKQMFVFKNAEVVGDGIIDRMQYVKCLTPGTYYLRASGPLIATRYSGGMASLATAKQVVVNSDGTVADVSINVFRKNMSSICGKIVDEAGAALTDATIYSSSATRIFSNARVGADGSFCLTGLESPGVYSLVAANNTEFSPYGTGGKKYAYYGNTHDEPSSTLINLTDNVSGLIFVYSPADTSASPDDVLPWNRFASPTPPVQSLADLRTDIDAGDVALASGLTTNSTPGVATIDAKISVSGDRDTSVDVFVVGNGTSPATSASASTSVTASAASSTKVRYLGRASIVNGKIILPRTIPVNSGLNQILLVSDTTKTRTAVPLVAGLSKPIIVQLQLISGTPKLNSVLTAPKNKWAANPSSVTVSYQWKRCTTATTGCSNISRATTSTYKVTAADRGRFVSVVVSAKNTRGTSAVTAKSVKVPRVAS